jgi:hypothetical protein
MIEQTNNPKIWTIVNAKPDEYIVIHKLFKETTNKKLSQYVRKVLLQKPVVIEYKDTSSDEILSALNRLSRELSAIEITSIR